MATRLYMFSSGTAVVTVTARSDWERSIAAATSRPLSASKGAPAAQPLTDVAALFGSTSTSDTLWMSFVSQTLDVDQSITGGTFSMVIRGLEGGNTEDAHLAYTLRVMNQAGDTERGLIASSFATGTEFTTSAETRIFNAVATSTVNALAGDRLCLEVGIHGVTPANSANITLRFGAPTGTADFALTEGLTTDLVPWMELSQTLTFGTPVVSSTPQRTTTGVGI